MTPAPAPLSLRTPAPLVRLLLVLSASAGMVDAVSLLGMERVLASNIAGNLVFAALAGAGVPGFALLPCCTALAAYAAGAAAAERISAGAARPGHGLVRAAAIESALLILTGFLVLGLERAGLLPGHAVLAVIALSAGAMGLRITLVRRLGLPDLPGTANAGTSGAMRLAALATFLGGAAAGAVLALHAGPGAALLVTGAMVLGAALVFARNPQMSEG